MQGKYDKLFLSDQILQPHMLNLTGCISPYSREGYPIHIPLPYKNAKFEPTELG